MGKKDRFYFEKEGDEFCYTKQNLQKKGITDAFEAVRTKGEDVINCKYYGIIDSGNCGNVCEKYAPRNGVKGICKMKGYIYTSGKKIKL